MRRLQNGWIPKMFFLALLGITEALQASTVLYYTGTARVSDLKTGKQATDSMIVRKTLDSKSSQIIEVACVKSGTQPAILSPVYMKVEGNRILSISNREDYKGNLTGTGELVGEAWDWNYLKFSMLWHFGEHRVRIEDGNFVIKDLLIARKQIFYDGSPIQLWDVEARSVEKNTFLKTAKELECPLFEW